MITDILWGRFLPNVCGNGAADSNRNKFVANTAVNDVALDIASAPDWQWVFGVPSSLNVLDIPYYTKLQPKDSVTLLSAGVMFPYHFTLSAPMTINLLVFGNPALGAWPIPEISNGGGDIVVPFANYEMSLGVYIPWSSLPQLGAATSLSFVGLVGTGRVSQIGTPASLNGVTITPVPFIKIQHTLPLLH